MKKLNKIEVCEPELNTVENTNSAQRTAEWFEKRKGRFTGSMIKELMSCSRSTAKMEWGRVEKLIDLGEAAKKYIFTKAMERKTGIQVKTHPTAAMRYGTENEAKVKELLNRPVDEVDFLEFIPNIAGASPDGKIKWIKNYAGLEIKCATDWNNFYNRVMVPVCYGHIDFWQLQAEMLALKVDKILYVVAQPSEDIFEANITDIQTQIVDASPIHQEQIIHRCLIGNDIIELFLNDTPFYEAIEKATSNYDPDRGVLEVLGQ